MRGRFSWKVFGTGVAIVLAIAPSCGSRSGLELGAGDARDASDGFGGGSGAGGKGGSGIGGSAGSAASSGSAGSSGSSGTAGSAGVGGTLSCAELATGSAIEVLSLPGTSASAPSAVLLPELSPARIALQAFADNASGAAHPDIELARFIASDASPSGVELELSPMLVGIESHGWANLVHAPGGLRELALTWHGDPGGYGRPMFRRIEIDGWTPGAPIDIQSAGEAVLDTAAGASTGAMGVGYAGKGYAAIWRKVTNATGSPTEPLVAVLDEQGSLVLGPHSVAPPIEYPGRSPNVIWSGATYLLATSFGTEGIQIARLRPASGDAVDDSGVELANVIPVPDGMRAGRPALALAGSEVIVAWLERPLEGVEGPSHVRVVRASPDGNLIVDLGTTLAVGVPQTRVTLHAGSTGVVVVWAEAGDANLSDSTPGKSRIMVVRLAPGLDAPPVWTQIASPQIDDYGPPQIVSRGSPSGLLVVWSARSQTNPYEVVYGARLDCLQNPQNDVKYEAFWGPPMALDRFYVVERDVTRNVCFSIRVAHPYDSAIYPIALPPQWSVESLLAEPDAQGCNAPGGSQNAVMATTGSGAIDWIASQAGAYPCAIDVAVSATFAPSAPWVPTTELLTASALSIVGGPCGG